VQDMSEKIVEVGGGSIDNTTWPGGSHFVLESLASFDGLIKTKLIVCHAPYW